MPEGLRIDRPVVDDGLRRWNSMASELASKVKDAVERIERLHAIAPWGGDSSGSEFQRTYLGDGGPGLLLTWANSKAGEIVDTGLAVRQSVDSSMEADAAALDRKA
jgi:hypothetical protein